MVGPLSRRRRTAAAELCRTGTLAPDPADPIRRLRAGYHHPCAGRAGHGGSGVSAFWGQLILGLEWAFFGYFLCITAAYLALHYVAVFSIVEYMRDHRAEYLPQNLPAYQPPISILIPAFNEERSINSTIHSLLQLDYPEIEVVIVSDGSTDATLSSVIREFAMGEFLEAYRQRI